MPVGLKNKGVPCMKLVGLICGSTSWEEINSNSELMRMISGVRVSTDKAFEFVDAAYNYLSSKGNGVVRPSNEQINSLVAKYQPRKRFSAKKVSDVRTPVDNLEKEVESKFIDMKPLRFEEKKPKKRVIDTEKMMDLLDKYHSTKDRDVLDALLKVLSPQIESICKNFAKNTPEDVSEFMSDGYFGAWDAIEKYDSGKIKTPKSFLAYVGQRIFGGIVDALRNRVNFGRMAYKHIGKSAKFREEYVLENGVEPTPEEYRQYLVKIGRPNIASTFTCSDLSLLTLMSLDQELTLRTKKGEFNGLKELIASDAKTPLQLLFDEELREAFDLDLKTMPYNRGKIFRKYFLEGFTMRETGDIVGLSESRVCQVIDRFSTRNYFARATRYLNK